jgi:AraC-like DNA-binding protein
MLPDCVSASIYVTTLWIRQRGQRASGLPDALLSRTIGLAVAMSLAQAVRTFFPHVAVFREIVPITITAGLLSIAALAVRETFAGAAAEPPTAPGPRYAKSALDRCAAERLLASLDRAMVEDGWYREATLSLAEIARRLETRPHLVSQALNQVKGTTLAEYLATWRVAEARRLLVDRGFDGFTIDALSESAGFASRSAFYKAFKMREGVTPTEFRTRQRRLAPDLGAGKIES